MAIATTASGSLELWEAMPESKLELIDGRLIAGNSLVGSHYLLWFMLHTLGPEAALPFTPLEKWWATLAAVFQAPPTLASGPAWQAWAEPIDVPPPSRPAGPHFSWQHHAAYSALMLALYRATDNSAIGQSIQRFVMRLGEQAFLPDLQLFRAERLHLLRTYYFDGPADLVIEVTLPEQEAADTLVKRRAYAAGGVPEYWIVDPVEQTIEFLTLTATGYAPQPLPADGHYRSSSIPGLVCTPARLWEHLADGLAYRHRATDAIITIDPTAMPNGSPTEPDDSRELGWELRPLMSGIRRQPTPISFDQYITYCPEAKFELVNGKPHIGGWVGTRDTLGLLLRTFGMDAALKLLPPRAWVAGLLAEEVARQHDAGRRDHWWQVARQAATLLRTQFGIERIALIGDLLDEQPLNFWSGLTLVAWHMPQDSYAVYQALHRQFTDPEVVLLDAERAAPAEQERLARQGVMLEV